MRRVLLLFGFGLPLVIASCGGDEKAPPADPLAEVFHRQAQEEGLSRAQTQGRRLFARYCTTCHGSEGHGNGQNAYNLDPRPPDFEESLRKHPASYWREILVGGTAAVGRSALCPPWSRTLSADGIDALVAYLDVLAQPPSANASEEEAAEPPSVP